MGRYKIGDQTFRRKNLYMPCVIGNRFDDLSDDEKAAVYKATRWADLITEAEWPVVLRHVDAAKHNRSRLKKKLVHWTMAMGRIARLNPELFDQAMREARDLYREQIEEEHPLVHRLTAGKFEGYWVLLYLFDDSEVAEGPQPDGEEGR